MSELKTKIRKVATKCYYTIQERDNVMLNLSHGKRGLSELGKIDIYQRFRDLAYDKFGGEMFFEDFYDLFDEVYKEVEADKEWEALVHC